MENPKVSICIPAYRQPELLRKALNSALIQTYQDYEIIITDDSPDTSVEEVYNSYSSNKQIKYFRNDEKKGSPENWNEAIRRSKGEYIKMMHHDDYFTYNNSLELFVKLLDDNLDSEMAFSASDVVFDTKKKYLNCANEKEFRRLLKNPNILFYENKIGAPSAVIFRNRNQILFDNNLKWLVDIEFYIRKIQYSNILYSKINLVTTYCIEGRVTDYCEGNRSLELYEYFYLFEKIRKRNWFYLSISNYKVLFRLLYICKKYEVKSILEVRSINYIGKIYWEIKLYFFYNQISKYFGKK